jgi:cell shape-determining protein MreC
MQIISYSPNVGRREVIVDIGDRDVSVGFAATVNDVLVGEVVDVSSKRARVLLINDPRFRVIADTARGAKGLINSNYRQIILIDIAQNQPIQPGDTVRTLSSQYPNVHDVAIGVVDEIMNSDDLLKQALLSQPVELDNLQRISIP